MARASVFAVDSRQGAFADAGDLLLAIKDGAVPDTFEHPELGELLVGRRPGRLDRNAVTVFEALGLAIQDVAAATAIQEYAAENGIGTEIPFPEP